MSDRHVPPVPLARAAVACRCPRCGDGVLFAGLLPARPACALIALQYRHNLLHSPPRTA